MTPLNISFFSKVNVELGYNLKFTQCHRAATAVVNYRLSLAESRVKKCTKLSQNLLSFLLFSPLSLMSRRFSGLFFAQNRKFHNMHMKVGSLCQNIFYALHSPKGWKRMRKCSIKFEVAWKEKHKYFEREPWMQHTAMKLCKWTFHWFSIFLSLQCAFVVVYTDTWKRWWWYLIANESFNACNTEEWVTCWKEFILRFIDRHQPHCRKSECGKMSDSKKLSADETIQVSHCFYLLTRQASQVK